MLNLNDLKDFDSIRIFLASTKDIVSWSFGEIIKPETINYRTFKPERDGLFDERIFGPVKDYECYCGKYKRIRYKGVICDKCGVEVTHSRVRRERMGHINLASPVAHVWFFKGIPSKLALILDISPRNLESVIYFSSFIVTQFNPEKRAIVVSSVEKDLEQMQKANEKNMDEEISKIEKEVKSVKASKSKDSFVGEEEGLKVKQKVQFIRDKYNQSALELEREYRLIQKKIESVELFTILSDNEYLALSVYVDKFCKAEIGAEAILNILRELNLNDLSKNLKENLESAKGQKALKISKRLRVVEEFRRARIDPERMILNVMPVIPPDLRPLVQLEGGRFATADLNELYRRVINRNNRLKRLLDLGAPEIIIRNEKRMLQESVDALFDSSKQRQNVRTSKGKKQLRSLADMLKGKQGRFRQNLLGKRVDYSGRSVIVNGPELKLYECGLPKEMALELFKPFVMREILLRGLAPNVKSAKFVLESRTSDVCDILESLVKDHPVLLNRAPTLWRLGVQSFYPKLVDGNALRLHLCVCPGFNADFDGDQMAVHLPLSVKAIEEAKTSMLSINNLLRPADGNPYSVPTKIMLFGIYYMTSVDEKVDISKITFSSNQEAKYAFEASKAISLRQRINLRIENQFLETTVGRLIFNEILPESFGYINDVMNKKEINNLLSKAFGMEDRDIVVKLIDDLKDLGLEYGTISGHSVSLSDITIPQERRSHIDQGIEKVAEIDRNFKRGLITKAEAGRLTENVWNEATTSLDNAVWNSLKDDNPVKVLVNSGSSRASRDQVNQIAGIRGLIADPTGKIVELPILGNYKIGLSGLEYFASSRGARKGLADRALKTADSGYLTRRLVDVAQDVIIRSSDCGTTEGREMAVGERTILNSFSERILGKHLADDVKVGKKILVKKNVLLTEKEAEIIEKSGVQKIILRSPLTCNTRRGICSKCYGVDLMTRNVVEIGAVVGVSAAQSIGEPGTQLTMRTFYTGGTAGKDITQGLPRIEELVEARTPKDLSIMSEVAGIAKLTKSGDERKITIIPPGDSGDVAVEYMVDPLSEIVIEDNQLVTVGDKLTAGHLDLTELLRTTGIRATQKYILDEIQKVYASQGVAINDKHIEVIVRQMFNHVRIEELGDTSFLPGEIVTKYTFGEENEKIIAEGGNPATAKTTLFGITKASLETDSFLSAASFIQTSNVLTDASASGKVDRLLGLKENVILGRLIPVGERAVLDQ